MIYKIKKDRIIMKFNKATKNLINKKVIEI